MRARLALKLGILAIVALGSLSGCFLFTNTTTIVITNTDSVTYDCWVEGDYATFVLPFGTAYYDYSWTGSSTKTIYVYVDDGGFLYGDIYVNIQDGVDEFISIDLE